MMAAMAFMPARDLPQVGIDSCPIDIFQKSGDVSFSVRTVINEVGMFVDVERQKRQSSPNTTLVLGVRRENMEFFIGWVKSENGPTTGRHTGGGEGSLKVFKTTPLFIDLFEDRGSLRITISVNLPQPITPARIRTEKAPAARGPDAAVNRG